MDSYAVPPAPARRPREGGAAVVGLLLAAGAGRRMGGPKALLRHASSGQTWVERASGVLRDGGCGEVCVVVGAESQKVRAALTNVQVGVVEAQDWAEGMGASLRAGLTVLGQGSAADAVLVLLVDTPDVSAAVVRRVLGSATGDRTMELARAAYRGVPGHPVLVGRAHWSSVADLAVGDRGARDYLATHAARLVECGDLASGGDVDSPGSGLSLA